VGFGQTLAGPLSILFVRDIEKESYRQQATSCAKVSSEQPEASSLKLAAKIKEGL